jgi:tight adherence protein B
MSHGFGPGAVTLAAVACGTVFGVGLVVLARGFLLRREPAGHGPGRPGLGHAVAKMLPVGWTSRRMAIAVLGGVVAGALTSWPVGGILTAVGVLTLPGLLGPDRAAVRRTERLEALATWTEMLRDTLAAAAGLEQAVLATAAIAPAALEHELRAAASDLKSGRLLPGVLRDFARKADDPLADVVVAALVMAAEQQASHLASLLGELADAVREQVAMRQRISAGRASVRTGIRVTVIVTLGMAVGLVVLNRPYMTPYDSLTGQVVLAVVGALFAAGFVSLTVIGRLDEPVRLIGPPAQQAGAGAAAAKGDLR